MAGVEMVIHVPESALSNEIKLAVNCLKIDNDRPVAQDTGWSQYLSGFRTMMHTSKGTIIRTIWIGLLTALMSASALAVDVQQQKVAPWVMQRLNADHPVEVIVRMHAQSDLSGLPGASSRTARISEVVDRLRSTAAQSQQGVIQYLQSQAVEYKSFWINNTIWVRASQDVIAALSQRPDIAYVHANPVVAADIARFAEPASNQFLGSIEASISLVGAPTVWDQGVTGQQIIIGGQDTGYQWDHPALINSYRGWDGAQADHNYNWHDSIHSGGGSCGADSAFPCDDNNHGTHTMGTMVGDDGGTNRIGMAPGARWIGCRNMDQGNGTPATYTECFQWFIAPTDLNDENPDPAMAPHVINNSWGCPASEGCTDPTVMQTVVENVRAAGIVVVVSAGNSGSGCSSVSTPAAIYDASFTVGNTTIGDIIAGSSSRGPVTADSSNRMKPDISAPGTSIRSSIRNNNYAVFSGTSMAGPHVAGHLALLMSAEPSLIGDVDELERITRDTALQLTSTQNCGGTANVSPNNVYGFGRIQTDVAFNSLLSEEFMIDGFEDQPL